MQNYSYPPYQVTVQEELIRTTRTGHRQPLLTVTIWNEEEHRGVKIRQMVAWVDRKDYCEDVYREAIRTLSGQGNCCYEGKCSWI